MLINYFCSFSFFKPRHRVSPDFIKALSLAESRCDPPAVSSKNALGLGQIIHSTGKEVAREIYNTHREYRYVDRDRLQNLAKEDLFDLAINTLITRYLISQYNMRFDGKLDLVISAWNAGENIDSLKIGKPAPRICDVMESDGEDVASTNNLCRSPFEKSWVFDNEIHT